MEKTSKILLFIACMLTSICLPAKDKSMYRFLKRTDSFDFIKQDTSWLFSEIEVSPYSFIKDSVEYIAPDWQNLWETDSFMLSLIELKKGTIYKTLIDSTLVYYKVISADSVLSIKYTYYGYELNSKINIDTVSALIQQRLKLGLSWNNSGYINIDSSAWAPEDKYADEFMDKYLKLKPCEMFLYKDTALNRGWLIIKTDIEKYFRRNKILTVQKKH